MRKSFLSKGLWAWVASIAVVGALSLSACDKDDDDDRGSVYSLSGDASGSQEVPPVTTNGSGTISGTYDTASRALVYTVTWTGLSGPSTVAHFHGPAMPGENAGPIQDLLIETNGPAGTASASITASDALHSALVAGKVYYNVHTDDFPDGEIRGQVTLKK